MKILSNAGPYSGCGSRLETRNVNGHPEVEVLERISD